jgi:hypothetical protein
MRMMTLKGSGAGAPEEKLFDNRLVARALIVSDVGTMLRAFTHGIPYDTPFGRTSCGTGRLVVVTYTFDTFVAVYVVNLLTCRVIIFVNNSFNRALIDTSTTVDTCIINQNCHEVSCFWFRQTIAVRFLNAPKKMPFVGEAAGRDSDWDSQRC